MKEHFQDSATNTVGEQVSLPSLHRLASAAVQSLSLPLVQSRSTQGVSPGLLLSGRTGQGRAARRVREVREDLAALGL